jgi:hypothetical protein
LDCGEGSPLSICFFDRLGPALAARMCETGRAAEKKLKAAILAALQIVTAPQS